MRINRKLLKRNMLDAIHDGKTNIIWVGLVYILLYFLLQFLSLNVSGELAALMDMAEGMLSGTVEIPQVESPTGSSLLVFAMDIMVLMLSVGFSVACLATARRKGASVGNLFDGFSCFLRAIGVEILQYLIFSAYSMIYILPVSLLMLMGGAWMVLAPVVCLPLLVPVIQARLAYRQAVYLMLDHPELTAFGCLRVSRELMKGRKWELFKLDLSFLGWVALCLIPLAMIWVLPYMQVCFAGYYDIVVEQYKSKMGTAAKPPEAPEGE